MSGAWLSPAQFVRKVFIVRIDDLESFIFENGELVFFKRYTLLSTLFAYSSP